MKGDFELSGVNIFQINYVAIGPFFNKNKANPLKTFHPSNGVKEVNTDEE